MPRFSKIYDTFLYRHRLSLIAVLSQINSASIKESASMKEIAAAKTLLAGDDD